MSPPTNNSRRTVLKSRWPSVRSCLRNRLNHNGMGEASTAQGETGVSAWKQSVIPSPRQRQEDCKIEVKMDSEFKASLG